MRDLLSRRTVSAALGGALLCVGLIHAIGGFVVIGADMGAKCGGVRSGPCPQGFGWSVAIGLVCSISALFVLVFAHAPGGRRRPRLVASVTAVAVAFGPGLLLFHHLRGTPPVRPVWSAPLDRPGTVRAVAVWQDGDTVVRVRDDGLFAYHAKDGALLWKLPAEPREVVCAASPGVQDGVAAVGFKPDGGACTAVAAVDLRGGKQLWRTGDRSATVNDGREGSLAVAGGAVVVREPGRVRSLGLRDGAPRWSAPVSAGCRNDVLGAAPTRIAVVEVCAGADGTADGTAFVRAFDPADGRALWRTDLGVRGRLKTSSVLSAEPVALRITESAQRGVDGVLSFGADGRLRATLPVSDSDLDLAGLQTAGFSPFSASAPYEAVVTGDLLITSVRAPADTAPRAVAAYSLADGQRRWLRRFDGEVTALAGRGDDALVLVGLGTKVYELRHLAGATGRPTDRTEVRQTGFGSDVWLGETGDRYLVVQANGTASNRPAYGLPRR